MNHNGFEAALSLVAKDRTVREGEYNCRQCLSCSGYLEFRYPEGADWGVCLKRESQCNGLVVFEHFGCDQHVYRKD